MTTGTNGCRPVPTMLGVVTGLGQRLLERAARARDLSPRAPSAPMRGAVDPLGAPPPPFTP
jgi:hypothetical protein